MKTDNDNKKRILVVDDTQKNIQVLGPILKQHNYQINVALNGEQALESVKRALPDLILLDVMMPEMDGFETCRHLKDDPRTREIPVIFLTARAETQDVIKGFETGAVDYVTKPFNAVELLARVKNHLDLKDAREKLEQSYEKLKRETEKAHKLSEAISFSPSSVMITDSKGIIEYVNPKFTEVTGYELEEATGQRPSILKSGHTDPEVYKEMWQALESGNTWYHQIQNRRKDGTVYWEYLSIAVVRNDKGEIINYIGVSEDLTEHMEKEQLILEKKAIEMSSGLKDQFLSTISHELRTPINGILGMAELLHETLLDDEQKEFLDIINRSTRSLMQIINDILHFLEIEADRVNIDELSFSLQETLESSLNTARMLAQEKGLEMSCTVGPEVPDFLLGDEPKLSDILGKLADNAIKFTPKGSVDITISMKKHKGATAYIDFRIEDTGIGIPENMREEIFKMFTQVDGTSTRYHEGTGIGLSISSTLIHKLGGELELESDIGKGTTICFTLPFQAPDLTPDKENTEINKPRPLQRPSRDLHILVVDHDKINRDYELTVLERQGHHLSTAANGREALVVLDLQQVDVVLLDLNIPFMSAFEVATELREKEKGSGSRLTLIGIATEPDGTLRDRAIQSGIDDFVSLPITPDELLDVIARNVK